MTLSVDSIKQSIELEGKFAQYRVIRSWGMLLILLGILIISDKMVSLILEIAIYSTRNNSYLLNSIIEFKLFFYPTYLVVIFGVLPLFLIVYTFLSVKRIKIDEYSINRQNIFPYGTVMLFFYPSAFIIPFLFSLNFFNISGITPIDIIGRVSVELFSFSFSCFISFFSLNMTIKDYKFKELLRLGVIFLTLSLGVFIYHFSINFVNIGLFLTDLINIPNSIFNFPFFLNLAYLALLLVLFTGTGMITRRNSTSFYLKFPSLADENIQSSEVVLEKGSLVIPENQIFFSQVRFTILLILTVHTRATFSELQKLLCLTPGRLDY
ncbi:MAG: hypothetical protein ACW99Q_24220, partial [Candidatus Kariarchaeaceae archaeon]